MTELVFEHFDPRDERRREALFALGNGVLSWRASAPEAAFRPRGGQHYAGLYRAGWYDDALRLVNGEAVRLEALVNLPDPFGLSVSIDGRQWFEGACDSYRQALDLDHAVLRRELQTSLGGQRLRLREERFLSLCDPTLAVLRWTLEVPSSVSGLHLRSRLDASVGNELVERDRPYEGRRLEVQAFEHDASGRAAVLAHLPACGARVGVACRLSASAALHWQTSVESERLQQEAYWQADGEVLVLEKRVRVKVDDELPPSLAELMDDFAQEPYESLLAQHAQAWEERWATSDTAFADSSLATPLRLNILHVLQTMPPLGRDCDQGFPPRGWHEGYFGQIFWDEMFAFPFLASRFPEASRQLLHYRHRRLGAARQAAREAGRRGAMFPWRSARSGTEQTPPYRKNPLSGRWMADPTCLQRHIGAAVVYDVWQHYQMTGELAVLAGEGGELMIEIARFWASAATFDDALGRYAIRGVIGPDEYHNAYPGNPRPGLDNNAYTNLMAAWVLCRAVDLLERLPDDHAQALRRRLQLDAAEPGHWDEISRRLYLPFLADGVLNQFDGYERLLPAPDDWLNGEHERLDWWLEARGDCCDRYQPTKQADVLTLLHLFPPHELRELCAHLGYRFDETAMRRTADYHMARIAHESSLSKMVCAGALAHLDPEASWQQYCGCLRTDLESPPDGGTQEGVHLGAMAGALDVLQRHYLGIYPGPDALHLRPAAPPALDDVTLGFLFHGQRMLVHLRDRRLTLELAAGAAPVEVCHAGGRVRLTAGERLTLDCPAVKRIDP
ncbi:glycoside hydrolase family 65 protein [Pseudomonas subflava]|uniref:glycoside hydrolase family 65 protein n=1 Tax=Pseudomonas subflava TaxID=2952933 RepID=UPI002079976D